MSIAAKLRRAPIRLTTGAFIVNSGLGKLKADEETAQGLHGFAVGAYPFLKRLSPTTFAKLLGVYELGVGGLLLAPFVPAGVAALALTGFSGGLLGLYAKTPALHDKYYRPTHNGVPVSKDVWMFGGGLALLLDAVTTKETKVVKADD